MAAAATSCLPAADGSGNAIAPAEREAIADGTDAANRKDGRVKDLDLAASALAASALAATALAQSSQ